MNHAWRHVVMLLSCDAVFTVNIYSRAVEMQEEKLKAKAEQLRYKEESMKEIEERYENRLKDEIIKLVL